MFEVVLRIISFQSHPQKFKDENIKHQNQSVDYSQYDVFNISKVLEEINFAD